MERVSTNRTVSKMKGMEHDFIQLVRMMKQSVTKQSGLKLAGMEREGM